MRISAILAGLYLVSATTIFNVKTTNAIPIKEADKTKLNFTQIIAADVKPGSKLDVNSPQKTKIQKPDIKKTKPIRHTIENGETLTKIAAIHKVNWQRIYDKNLLIKDPDQISVGDELVIPGAKEKLKKRSIPVTIQLQEALPTSGRVVAAQPINTDPATAPTTLSSPGSSAGNTYYYGYCTYYAKSRRPDLPNNLGNADTWVVMAAAQGLATGSAPRAGAIGQQGMHVVYIESVNNNGTVTVSEMNFNGWGVVSSRTVPASTFMYIY